MRENLEQYKVFYYVVKCGGITAAAETLSITQPAVSQAIKQLENSVHVTLFLRTARGVRLTSEGQALYAYVAEGYETILRGEQKLREMINLDAGEIRIGASDMTLKYYLLPYLEQFHERYPKIKVTVYNSPTPETLQSMQDHKIDFGLISSPLPEKTIYTVKVLRKIEDIFVAGSRFSELQGRKLKFAELEELPVICLEKCTSTRTYVDRYLYDNGVVLHPEFELATSDMIVQFALRNLGIGCVVRDFAEEALAQKTLFEVQFEQRIPNRHLYVAYHERQHLSLAAQKLLDLIV